MVDTMLIPYTTLFHKPRDFVALLTDMKPERGLVCVEYYKWLPYDQPDNKISGMNGWYRNEEMLPWEVPAEHPIFKQYGLPPGYKPSFRRTLRDMLMNFGQTWAEGVDDPEPEIREILDFVPDPDRHNFEEIQREVRKRAQDYAGYCYNYIEAESDKDKAEDALNALVGYVLILAGKVSIKDV